MKCINCNKTLDDGSEFCGYCGARQPARCPECGEPIADGNTFCEKCGATAGVSTPPRYEEKPKNKRLPYIVAAVLAAGGIIACILIYQSFIGGSATAGQVAVDTQFNDSLPAAASSTPGPAGQNASLASGTQAATQPPAETAAAQASPAATTGTLANGHPDPESYILKGNQTYYSYAELNGFTREQVDYIRNGLFALSGKIFSTPKYVQYFTSKPWYVQYSANDENILARFNAYQSANLELVLQYETDRGWL